MASPTVIVTGASGFVGRHLLDRIKERYRIVGIARRSQQRCGAPSHPDIAWHQVDIADREELAAVFRGIGESEPGAPLLVVHLAAHYDFTGEDDPEYYRTNVDGLRNVLEECAKLPVRRFVFSSSVAACAFPPPGSCLTEDSPADGDHVYARTKRIGEDMLGEYRDRFPSTIVRFAALFSDWCEYPPLFMFLKTWLSEARNSRILGGKGESAIPYLHVRDATRFLETILDRPDVSAPGEVLICGGDGAVSHRELYEEATSLWYGQPRRPIHMPKVLCRPGIYLQTLASSLLGFESFERPWMARYIDKRLTINASRTHARTGWRPRERLEIRRRLPFLLENMKMDPAEWRRRNRAAMKDVRLRPNLKIHALLRKHEPAIHDAFTRALTGAGAAERFPSYQEVNHRQLQWNHGLALHELMAAVRTRERAIYTEYCGRVAEQRFEQGFRADEVCGAFEELNRICIEFLSADPESSEVHDFLYPYITMTMRFGCDQVLETFERLEQDGVRSHVSTLRSDAHRGDVET